MIKIIFAITVIVIAILIFTKSITDQIDSMGLVISMFFLLGGFILLPLHHITESKFFKKNYPSQSFNAFMPDTNRYLLCIGLLCYVFSIMYFNQPGKIETGRWAWLFNSITEIFGPYGMAIFFLIAGTVLLISSWKK